MNTMRAIRSSFYLSHALFGAWRGYHSRHKTPSGGGRRTPEAVESGTVPLHSQQQQRVDNKGPIGAADSLGIIGLLEAASLAYLVFSYFLSSSIMVGPSMMPTFRPQGDIVLVDRISHRRNRLQPGENLYRHFVLFFLFFICFLTCQVML